ITIAEWVEHLLETNLAAITLHLRTKKEMSNVEAHWETVHEAVELARQTETLLLANGDLDDLDQADKMIEQTGIDGVMMARAIYGFPWLFDRTKTRECITVEERLSAMIEHSLLYEKVFDAKKNFAVMIKHLRAYATGFDGAKELRVMMEDVKSSDNVESRIDKFRKMHSEIHSAEKMSGQNENRNL
ncbi:MAG: tRNA-dihydrouridine synthase, partial [candidate division Zixibacteria bacterium]|nr:tRNA-dihydrouridine synthase [candidate division Zixibacteria bacterium]